MYLIYNKILVSRSSKSVYWFRMEPDDEGERLWQLYHTIDKPAFISFTNGNVRMQLIQDKMIYFYLVDKVTLMPELEGAMNNYFNCNQMIIGKFVRYAITYKTNQPSFSITRRQYTHDFLV